MPIFEQTVLVTSVDELSAQNPEGPRRTPQAVDFADIGTREASRRVIIRPQVRLNAM